MAKTNPRLPQQDIERYFYRLCLAIYKTNNVKEAAELMRDLLTDQESEMLARRLEIAELLLKDMTYEEIRKKTKASPVTIAKVQEWLRISGEGYRMAIKRTSSRIPKERSEDISILPFSSMKKRFPMYYWPEILLENVIKNANKREREEFKSIISEMKKLKRKSVLHRKLEKILANPKA